MTRKIREYVENKKYTLQEIKEYCEKEGCVLLSTKYTDNKQKLDVRFKCGCIGTTSFNNFQKGCRCSNNECMTLKKKETSMELFGKEWYTQTEECQQKIKETCQKKYGVDHYRQTVECEERLKNTNLTLYGKEYFFQTDIFKEKTKKRCIDDFGVEYYSQVQEVKDKIIDTNMKKYGCPVSSQNEEVKTKMIQTNISRYNVPFTLMNKDIYEKAKNRVLDIYGVDNVSRNQDIQDKKVNTSIIRYGTNYPMQSSTIYEKSRKNAYALEEYNFPSGKSILVQGYEPFALDDLLKIYNEDDIITGTKSMPEIWYHSDDGKYHRYYPDIYIPKDNLLIEVKSTFTLEKNKTKVDITRNTCKALGFNFELHIYDRTGIRLN